MAIVKCPQCGANFELTPQNYNPKTSSAKCPQGHVFPMKAEAKEPSLKEKFTGRVLDGYVEASRVKTLEKFGQPKTDEERRITHEAKYGTEELPPKGTGKPTAWDEDKLKEQNRVCKAIEDWLDAKGVPYKSDVGFVEFPRPGVPKGKFQKLVREAENKFRELDITKSGAYYDVFETTIVVDFPEQKRWFEAIYR